MQADNENRNTTADLITENHPSCWNDCDNYALGECRVFNAELPIPGSTLMDFGSTAGVFFGRWIAAHCKYFTPNKP